MERVICHWTAGHYSEPNAIDRATYHILVEKDGRIVYGTHPIADNVSTADGNYAPHTTGLNASSIGLACCAMYGCREEPFDPRSEPLTRRQWKVMCEVAAELCLAYDIEVSERTVLGHGEILYNLGGQQAGNWDPMVWPWEPKRTRAEVGRALRGGVEERLAQLATGEAGSRAAGLRDEARCGAQLRSAGFAGVAALAHVAEGHRVLRASGGEVEGIGAVQAALNQLAASTRAYAIDLGAGDKFRGYFGENTERAVQAFQNDHRLAVDGVIGQKTIAALDEAMVRFEAPRSHP